MCIAGTEFQRSGYTVKPREVGLLVLADWHNTSIMVRVADAPGIATMPIFILDFRRCPPSWLSNSHAYAPLPPNVQVRASVNTAKVSLSMMYLRSTMSITLCIDFIRSCGVPADLCPSPPRVLQAQAPTNFYMLCSCLTHA